MSMELHDGWEGTGGRGGVEEAEDGGRAWAWCSSRRQSEAGTEPGLCVRIDLAHLSAPQLLGVDA